MYLVLENKKRARVIDPAELEKLFAAGLSQNEVARALNFKPSYLSRRINDSKILTDAKRRGMNKL